MKANDPINPIINSYDGNIMTSKIGIDLRTHLAAMAMQGILSGADINNQNGIFVNDGYICAEEVAKDAVKIADALILELNKTV